LNQPFAKLLLFSLAALLAGCATDGITSRPHVSVLPVDANGLLAGTGFDATDVSMACDCLQRGLGTVPEIAGARRAVQIEIEPVANNTRYAVNGAAFNSAVRQQLAAWSPPQWHFVAGDSPSATVDYVLAGRLQHLRPLRPADGVTLLYSFQLIDARTSELVWESTAELKNQSFHETAQH
jgi:hypothetical protein